MKPQKQKHLHRLLLIFVCLSMTTCAFRFDWNVILALGLLYFFQLENILLQMDKKIWYVILITILVDCVGIGICVYSIFQPQEVFQLAKGYKSVQIIGAILTAIEVVIKIIVLWLLKTEKREEQQEYPNISVGPM